MAPNPRVTKAFRAMKAIGIPEAKVKPVLKNLLKLYEKNWELIEEENYRALADAIFDNDEAKEAEERRVENALPVEEVHQEAAASEAEAEEEPERPLKRLRLRHQDGQASSSVNNSKSNLAGTSLIKPKEEPNELLDSTSLVQKETQGATEMPQSKAGNSTVESQSVSCQPLGKNKGKEPVSPKPLAIRERSDVSQSGSADGKQYSRRSIANTVSHSMRLRDRGKQPLSPQPNVTGEKRLDSQRSCQAGQQPKETTTDHGNSMSVKQKMPCSEALIKPKEEPFTSDLPQLDILPIAVIDPESSNGELCNGNGSAKEQDDPEPSAEQAIRGNGTHDGVPASSSEIRANGELVKDPKERLEVAATPCGKVKIALTYDLAFERPDVHIPSLDAVLDMVKNKCLGTYKILDPSFSVTKVMSDMCNSFLELGTGCANSLNGSPIPECDAEAALAVILPLPPSCNILEECGPPAEGVSEDNREVDEESEQNNVEQMDCQNLVQNQSQPSPERISSLSDVIDIAKGQERVIISLVNDVNDDRPPSFHYIPQSAVFQNAYVNYSLARIGDNNCCSTCSGDCLSLATPCACAHEMGGDFAYTTEGLVKEDFLKECISMNRDPEKHCQYFCKICPLERSKNEDTVEPCKGHLVRKFIKECWWKCGCNKQCGNRVVQRGISRKLQVFMTPGGKGWGLRTLEDLPKGAFVCEYVGEVLTNAELFDRVSRSQKGDKHSYPVLLDADWGSEGVLKDEEALCLDATYYGNVARFINHRCFDSTLVEIPVEVETPDHHYYHLAFFTTRNVKAMEELTWDYGIDFDDIDHPVKAFRCQCGSKYCRNIKRTRSRRGSRR